MLLIEQYNLAPHIPWFRENSFEFNGNIEELIPILLVTINLMIMFY